MFWGRKNICVMTWKDLEMTFLGKNKIKNFTWYYKENFNDLKNNLNFFWNILRISNQK